jgi:hypothetical protein
MIAFFQTIDGRLGGLVTHDVDSDAGAFVESFGELFFDCPDELKEAIYQRPMLIRRSVDPPTTERM